MNKGKIRSLLVVFFVSAISLCSQAQYHQKILDMMNSTAVIKKEAPINLPDSLDDKNIDKVVSENLESLADTWYVKKAFKVDSLKSVTAPAYLNVPLPDSVYINRLRDLDSYIPLPYNQTVKNLITLYTLKRPGLVSIMMGLSNYYFPLFEEMLAKYNLPLELKYLAVIESALNPRAVSRAKASGLWQFMYGTAKIYDLEINSYIDERFDPIKSTEAAVRYLRDLYDIYGDWHVAIAAYNCGPGNINKAIRRSGGKQSYWEIYSYLPKETRGYVPTFIAATYAMNYASEHNLSTTMPSFDIVTDTIKLHSYYHFEQIAASLNIPVEELRQLNPQYQVNIIPARNDKPYNLKLPQDKISSFIDMQGEIYSYNREKFFPNNQIILPKGSTEVYALDGKKKIIYTVKRGDNPGSIAKRHHISTANLVKWNNIRHNMIRVGQKLAIYVPDKAPVQTKQLAVNEKVQPAKETIPEKKMTEKKSLSDEYTLYTVRSGDSLYTIAKQFNGVSDDEIIALNQIKNTRGLMPGQKLKIPIKSND